MYQIIANLSLQLNVRSADVEFPKVNQVLFKSRSNGIMKKYELFGTITPSDSKIAQNEPKFKID